MGSIVWRVQSLTVTANGRCSIFRLRSPVFSTLRDESKSFITAPPMASPAPVISCAWIPVSACWSIVAVPGGDTSPDGPGQSDIEFDLGIRALVATHVHIDHVGRIPYLLAAGFSGPILCSEPSARLLPIVLEDAFVSASVVTSTRSSNISRSSSGV